MGLFVFAILAASGPGRIDIVDGQTHFEVGRSLVEHGDSALRDQRIWWGSFPGRDGLNFTYYRLPQSVVAAVSIIVADAIGPTAEARRHFFFVWSSAAAAALLAIAYALFFCQQGYGSSSALLWALGGIFCTPNWYYGTSTFDEIWGSLVIVVAATVAQARPRFALTQAIVVGLLLGMAFNVKQTYGAFAVVCIAMCDRSELPRGRRFVCALIITLGLLAGVAAQASYDYGKFPFDKAVVHAEILKQYAPVYTENPLPAFVAFAISPGCGILWYCPPALLGLLGLSASLQDDRKKAISFLSTTALFVGFLCFVSFFKGDPAWGPRYLTPWLAFLWLYAPRGARLLSKRLVYLLLALGVGVQVLGLTVDPHRMFVARSWPSAVGIVHPWMYLQPPLSQLIVRPSEIIEIARDGNRAEAYSPAPAPTFTFPVLDPPYLPESGPEVIERYEVLRSFRPWWISQRYLPKAQRPVKIDETLALLAILALLGVFMMSVRPRGVDESPG